MLESRQADYRKALCKLSFLNTMITHDKKDYIIYFQPMENKGRCKIQVTNGFDFWVEDFDFEKFEQKRKLSGLEGTYNSYFDMMNRAVANRNFDIHVDVNQNFLLVLYFQLNKGVSLKGDFDLGRPLHFDDIKEFHNVYRLFLFDIFKAKDQERMKVETSRKSGKKPDDMVDEGDEPQSQMESKPRPPPRKKRPAAAAAAAGGNSD